MLPEKQIGCVKKAVVYLYYISFLGIRLVFCRSWDEVETMLIQISVAVIAVAFVALAVYAVTALRSVRDSLQQASHSIAELEKHMEQVSGETVKLLSSTNQLTEDLNRKLKHVDTFFESVGDVGQAVQQVASSVKQVSATVTNSVTGSVQKSVHTHQSKIDEAMMWAKAAMTLWQKISSLKTNKG